MNMADGHGMNELAIFGIPNTDGRVELVATGHYMTSWQLEKREEAPSVVFDHEL